MMVDYHRARWQPGDWTDDTDMMLCIAEAVIKDKELNPQSVAQNFKKWFLGCPKGIGRHTYNVLSLGDYVKNLIGQPNWFGRCPVGGMRQTEQ